ncbi:DNA alkylation repair protein [Aquimarina sp. 2201CG14-23]|uniref:DNA alkylation repair protein n=1 Tax=Aquimarina mycalae TaxID=3040073 RepID=UPI002477E889|nr:DNA alkylation repair protein [Aquimarina sp. 2201CG14-23]MDH7447121.1 DNA alkylation repair protein [Aquimarina sp. 2201CG14-23]
MKVITKKSVVKEHLVICLDAYFSNGLSDCINEFYNRILTQKVRFPLLEYCAEVFYERILEEEHINFCDQIQSLHTEGGNVILGIILQKRLTTHFNESLQKATEYIADADIWYVCDIIGERVFGFSLLTEPDKTIPEIQTLAKHPINWVIRSLGAGIHYSIKKGLASNYVDILFNLLLSLANNKDKEIRQGIGWAAKTTAKFHPNIIEHHKNKIYDHEKVANWFRKKISIGLNRHEYAKRNHS